MNPPEKPPPLTRQDLRQTCPSHCRSYLLKVVLGELVSDAQQLTTGVCVCKGPDSQTVGRIKLPLQEFTAGLLNLCQLEEASSREQGLDVPLLDCHLGMEETLFTFDLGCQSC